MRSLLVLMLAARFAHADDQQRFAMAGLGTSMSNETAGWALRIAARMDGDHSGTGTARFVQGGIVGLDVWSVGDRVGISFPTGAYAGAQVGSVRSTLGAGLGMYAFEKRSSEQDGRYGLAPFASATVEKLAGDLVIVLEGTVARQLILDRADHNVYSVMVMAGRRFDR